MNWRMLQWLKYSAMFIIYTELYGWLLCVTSQVNVHLLSLQVSIVPRTNAALGFAQYTTTDKKLYSEVEVTNVYTS